MDRVLCGDLSKHIGSTVVIKGWVHRVRALSQVRFVIVRDRSGLAQAVLSHDLARSPHLAGEAAVRITGEVVEAPTALGGVEVQATTVDIEAMPVAPIPFEVNLPEISAGLEKILEHRVVSLRHPKTRAVFKIEAEAIEGFRQFLRANDFTEVHTPKIVSSGTEGGAELFSVKYFEKDAYLAQSPQFYKQMLVGAGFERVFEVAPAYRAEEHNTSRHLNEFISLDLEVGFIEGLEDLLSLEERLLRHLFAHVQETCAKELAMFGVTLPEVPAIPRLKLSEIEAILLREYGKALPNGNIDPEGERLICRYVEREAGTPFVFVTHYPVTARPVYALPDPDATELTLSFDLLFKGLEMNSGGMRINDYEQLVENIRKFGLNPDSFAGYLEVFKYSMPRHGGFAIGAERLTTRIVDLGNIREASLFPRDRERLTP